MALAHLLDGWVVALVQGNYMLEASRDRTYENFVEWEDRVEEQITTDNTIEETEKSALVLARRGQGKYRDRLLTLERACRITRVDRPNHLVASHTKPWRDSSNSERLDPENGFMLTPTIDHLFDKGFISFEDNGDLLISPVAHLESLKRMKIPVELRPTSANFRAVRSDSWRGIGSFCYYSDAESAHGARQQGRLICSNLHI